MDISLEKIDAVIARTAATFKEAKEALEKNRRGGCSRSYNLIEESRNLGLTISPIEENR